MEVGLARRPTQKGDSDVHPNRGFLLLLPDLHLPSLQLRTGDRASIGLLRTRAVVRAEDRGLLRVLRSTPGPRGVSSSRGPDAAPPGGRFMEPMKPSDAPDAATLPSSSDVVAVLVENHRRFLAFLERRVGSRDVAEDILQDALVRGLARAGQLRDRESVVAWFYRSLRNALVDHWRRSGAERRAIEELVAGADSEPSVDPELMKTVCECATALLDTLKPEYAEALRRVELEGVSVKDFAREKNVSPNTASVRLFRARESLRRQLERSCGTCAEHGCLDCTCGGPACG